jgi:hypothetical protein
MANLCVYTASILTNNKISPAFYGKGDFFSSPLDEQYTYYDFAYVENNPVKAKMVENATDYKYSSAMCQGNVTGVLGNTILACLGMGLF